MGDLVLIISNKKFNNFYIVYIKLLIKKEVNTILKLLLNIKIYDNI